MTNQTTWYDEVDTPIGALRLVANEGGLTAVEFLWGGRGKAPDATWIRESQRLDSIHRQLQEYFDGRRRVFDVELAPLGTPFQRSVWEALRDIPFGASISYAELARRIGRPTAFRAVGAANGANPWPIIVPCHRVIGSDRSLAGFGGGLDVKRRLLLHEAEAQGAAWLNPGRR